MHVAKLCIYEESGDRHKAYLVLDQTNKVCGVVEDAARRADCEARVQELRAHVRVPGLRSHGLPVDPDLRCCDKSCVTF